MIDYFFKAQFLETDLPLYQRKISKLIFERNTIIDRYGDRGVLLGETDKRQLKAIDSQIDYWQDTMKAKYGFDFRDSMDSWIECEKINRAYYQRVKRLLNKVQSMLEHKCLFLTFTFDDKHIKVKDTTKRKYVQRMLNELKCPYVANIDYGKKHQRVHYHALVQIEHIDNTGNKLWHCGDLDIERIRYNNEKAISKYICKLTNHAIKETTRGNRLLYDKK